MQGTCETYSLPGAKHLTGHSSIGYIKSTSGWYLLSIGSPNEPRICGHGCDECHCRQGKERIGTCSLTEDAVRPEAGIEGPECVGIHKEPCQGHVHE